MNAWLAALLVAVGGGCGAAARHHTAQWLRTELGATPVAGILVANVIGSFILGLFAGAAIDGARLALVGIGFCGAYTTFSTFSLDLWEALHEGRIRHAIANVTVSLTLGLLAAYAGFALTR